MTNSEQTYLDWKHVQYEKGKRDPHTWTFLAVLWLHYAHLGKRWRQGGYWVSCIFYATPLAFVPFFRWIYLLCVHKRNINSFNDNLRKKYGIEG